MDAQTRYGKHAYFSGKRFVPLIFHLFSIEGGARHPWQLSAIATAIATWLGALSRSHGTRAHHKGGANSGEVQKTAQGERKGCTRTWKTNAPRAHRVVHRVVHRAHRAYVSLLVLGQRRPAHQQKADSRQKLRGRHMLYFGRPSIQKNLQGPQEALMVRSKDIDGTGERDTYIQGGGGVAI